MHTVSDKEFSVLHKTSKFSGNAVENCNALIRWLLSSIISVPYITCGKFSTFFWKMEYQDDYAKIYQKTGYSWAQNTVDSFFLDVVHRVPCTSKKEWINACLKFTSGRLLLLTFIQFLLIQTTNKWQHYMYTCSHSLLSDNEQHSQRQKTDYF